MEEIYLLRRLIHTNDTGHLASINHGTPRQDLRPDQGSVDIDVTAAGDAFPFQLKTFKYGVSTDARARQNRIIDEALHRLEGSGTHLVVLEAESVKDAFERSVRQGMRPTSRADKYATFQPLCDVLETGSYHRLLSVLGLTEADLEQEKAEFNRLTDERRKQEQRLDERRSAERQREEANETARREHLKRQELARERERLEEEERQAKIEALHQAARAGSQKERDEAAAAKAARERERQEQFHRDAEARATEAARQAALEARRAKAKERKKEGPKWPPKKMVGLVNVLLLKSLGILSEDWRGDFDTLRSAKESFYTLFAKTKRGKLADETDPPNDLFRELFSSKADLASPSIEAAETVARLLEERDVRKAA